MPLKITDLHSLMVHERKDLNAEHQLLEALPKSTKLAMTKINDGAVNG